MPIIVIYGSDFSVQGYRDQEFGTRFAWDSDLLAGYESFFLTRVAEGGAQTFEEISVKGFSAQRLTTALAKYRPRAVLLTGYSPAFHRKVFWPVWRARYPLLFRGETTDVAHSRSLIKSLGRDLALRVLYAQCKQLLYVGQRSREHYERLGCAGVKLKFAPYCVDVSVFRTDESAREILRPTTRAMLRISEDQIALLFVGKLVARKGPDLLLEAVRTLPDTLRQRVVVMFLGSGEMQSDLEKSAGHIPEVAARFIGFQNQTALSQYYHAADLMVLPSRDSETWGLVVNEALQHGVPCVVSDRVGCAPDLIEVGVTGGTFSFSQPNDLGRALQDSVGLLGEASVRSACRTKVEGYSVARAAEGLAQAFASVAGAG